MTSAVNNPAGVSVSPKLKELATSSLPLNKGAVSMSSLGDGCSLAFMIRHLTLSVFLVAGILPIDFISLAAGNMRVVVKSDRMKTMQRL